MIDPTITKLETDALKALLTHVNPETKLAYKDDPALAWVTLAGEVSLFNVIDDPSSLPGDYAKELRSLAAKSTSGSGRRFWQSLESAHYKALADVARGLGLKAPIAGVSHWRREPEFCEAQAAIGLDLIDDRIFWLAPPLIAPRFRSALWSLDGGIIAEAARKRRPDRPYVVGQWCDFSGGVWALPFEGAEQLLAAASAVSEDWDALVRRGVFLWPDEWGKAATGTSGGEDIFQIPEVANASPQVFALWPHAASLMLRGHQAAKPNVTTKARPEVVRRQGGRGGVRKHPVPGWEPERGRLVVNSAYTQGVAGWPGAETATLPSLMIDVDTPYAVVVASSASTDPIARSNRLLVTAIGRVTPTGFTWVDPWRKETADPGRPPLLVEPVKGTVTWLRKGNVKAYLLDNDGKRLGPAKTKVDTEGTSLLLDGSTASVQFEMVVE